jgi:2-polyprenyl-6-hydroxyphenyl methylase/3-demethylubiquinone-9 3-methyltransferase
MSRNSEPERQPPATPSIDPAEVAKFEAIAAQWWDPEGKFKPLHLFNPVRLEFIRSRITTHFARDSDTVRPLEGLRLLDIGCGGGLVSEPMARMGALVTGIDASPGNIKTAMTHAAQSGLTIDYRAGTAEGLLAAAEPPFDVVLNLEVVEHVADPAAFLRDTARLLAPGGLMVVATINRTARALATAIIGAEYILGWLPRGTHQFEKLVRPDEVRAALTSAGLSGLEMAGVSFSPLTGRWRVTGDTGVNYMVVGRRPAAGQAANAA